ncbi:Uncharacterised protein [uncultured Ruminococcus sp.]|nr:Uncharacterised protein [uncultured Ruminococcus sp.]
MEVKKCPNCGAEIPEDREYCEQCEEQLKQTAGTSKREEMNQNSDLAETVVSQDEAIDEVAVQAEMEQEVTDNKETLLNQGKKKINRAIVISAIGWIVLIIIGVTMKGQQDSRYKVLKERYESINTQLSDERERASDLQTKVNDLQAKLDELENGASTQLVEIKNAYENGEWQNVIDLAGKLHEKYNGSEEDKEAQEMAKNSQSKLDEAAAAKAAEEAQGYETGITYDQLARTPDDFKGKKVKFTGKVVQVIEGSGSIQIRLAVNDNYDTILFGQYDSSIVGSRVLEDDHITIYGTSAGTISYQSTMGGTITIPGVSIEKIDQ